MPIVSDKSHYFSPQIKKDTTLVSKPTIELLSPTACVMPITRLNHALLVRLNCWFRPFYSITSGVETPIGYVVNTVVTFTDFAASCIISCIGKQPDNY